MTSGLGEKGTAGLLLHPSGPWLSPAEGSGPVSLLASAADDQMIFLYCLVLELGLSLPTFSLLLALPDVNRLSLPHLPRGPWARPYTLQLLVYNPRPIIIGP